MFALLDSFSYSSSLACCLVGDSESREIVIHKFSMSGPMSLAKSLSIAVMSVLLIHKLLTVSLASFD